jgi:hypothetical protein
LFRAEIKNTLGRVFKIKK